MRTGIVCLTGALGLAVLAHAGEGAVSEHEALVKDFYVTLGRVNKLLEGISDMKSAADAGPGLKKEALHLRGLRKKALQLKQPAKKEKDRLEKLYREKFDEVLSKLRIETRRVKGIPGGAEALKEIAVEVEKKAKDPKGKKDDKDKK
jgi:hypothetical protein